MIFHVRKHNQSERTLAKQLRSNHRKSFKTHQKNSAVTMMGLVIGVFLVCYGIHLRCSLVVLFDTNASCKDEQFKIPVLVLNSAVNPLSYAFFKRDINKELRNFIEHGFFLMNKNRRKAIFNWAAKGLFFLREGGGYTHSGYHKTLSATIACNRISCETET